MKGRISEAQKILKRINPLADINTFVAEVTAQNSLRHETIFTKKYRGALLLVFFIAFFNQFSGINGVLYYSKRIFVEAGMGDSAALLNSVGIGVVNLVFTLAGMALIDRAGRKYLMYIGSVGYIISLSLVALSFFLGWKGLAVPVFIFLFIAAHAIGQGAVIWVFIAELFPNHLRAAGQAFGSSVHWVLAAAIPALLPALITEIGAWRLFAFFALMMVAQLAWVIFKMPETKGASLEEVSKRLTG
jgi:MFS family permease